MRVRDKAWSDFVAWCKARRLRSLPAHAWTVAAYARWCERRHRYPVVATRIKAIARAHILYGASAPDRHPIVAQTLRTIEMREHAGPQRAALFSQPDFDGSHPKPVKAPKAISTRRRALRLRPRLVARRPDRG